MDTEKLVCLWTRWLFASPVVSTGSKRCEICLKDFSSSYNMVCHKKRVHFHIKPHACPVCDSSFAVKQELTAHVNRVHKNNRPFKCTECPKRFVNITERKAHLERHSGIRRYKCDSCDRAFTTNNDLWKHAVKHRTTSAMFTCSFCKKTFKTVKGFGAHMKNKHYP